MLHCIPFPTGFVVRQNSIHFQPTGILTYWVFRVSNLAAEQRGNFIFCLIVLSGPLISLWLANPGFRRQVTHANNSLSEPARSFSVASQFPCLLQIQSDSQKCLTFVKYSMTKPLLRQQISHSNYYLLKITQSYTSRPYFALTAQYRHFKAGFFLRKY